jgi:hypothetical protein
MNRRACTVKVLTAERLRRRADDVIYEAEIVRSRDARERLRDAAARLLEAASYEEREAAFV